MKQKNILKIMRGYSPKYASSNRTSYGQTETDAIVPLKKRFVEYFV